MISERDMMRGVDFNWSDVTGWIASQKLWDVRLYWDGKTFWTRGGIEVAAPDWFKVGLPDCAIDGGLYIPGERTDRAAVDAVNFGRFPATARFAIYDAPDFCGNKIQRLAQLAPSVVFLPQCEIQKHWIVESLRAMAEKVADILEAGGEGLMLTEPKSGYLRQRTAKLLKLKFVPHEFLFQ